MLSTYEYGYLLWICFVVVALMSVANLTLYFLDNEQDNRPFEAQAMAFGSFVTLMLCLMSITFVRDRLIEQHPREMARIVYMMKDKTPHFTRYKSF